MRRALPIACTALAVAAAAPIHAWADAPRPRGELMKTCMAEWKVKKSAPGGETLKYTTFLSECLKRLNADNTSARR